MRNRHRRHSDRNRNRNRRSLPRGGDRRGADGLRGRTCDLPSSRSVDLKKNDESFGWRGGTAGNPAGILIALSLGRLFINIHTGRRRIIGDAQLLEEKSKVGVIVL